MITKYNYNKKIIKKTEDGMIIVQMYKIFYMKKVIVLLAIGFSLAYCNPSQQAGQTNTDGTSTSGTGTSGTSGMSTDSSSTTGSGTTGSGTTGSSTDTSSTTTPSTTDSLPH